MIGPPGSGKTTYCDGMSQFLRSLGRQVALFNLDPANEQVPYQAEVNISDLIQLEEVMAEFKLGPNGGLVYCMEFLEENFDWLVNKVKNHKSDYLIIDCPGQVELYTHNAAVRNIIAKLEKMDVRLCAVHLVDAHYCSDPSKFISVCLTSLNTMLQIALPQVNVLSKVDLIEKYGKLQFNIDFYTDVLDLHYLVDAIADDPFMKKYKKLNEAMTELIENYSLVSFIPLDIRSKERMLNIRNSVDKANGYCFGSDEERNLNRMLSSAMGGADFDYVRNADIREKVIGGAPPKKLEEKEEKLGNDLDVIEREPGFQI